MGSFLMRVDEITISAELEKLERPWQELWANCDSATPFQSPAWLIPWWNSFHPGELITLAFWEQQHLTAVAPMFLFNGTIRLLGAGNTDYLDILCEPESISPVLQLLFNHLTNRRSEWDSCDFTDLSSSSLLLRADTSALFADGRSECSVCPVLTSKQLNISKKLCANLESARRCLERSGGFVIEQADDESVPGMIDALIDLHEARWNKKGSAGVLCAEDVRQFNRRVAPALSRAGLLRLYGLRHQGQWIAVHYCLSGHGRTYYYLGSFNPWMASYSPGNLLIHHSIMRAIETGDCQYDFLRGREAHKYRWGAKDTKTFRLLCHSKARARE
jgi:CelD/BcsL family acetyltransferase involved in cellulose biosynthesis